MSEMTLEMVRDWHRRLEVEYRFSDQASNPHKQAADAIDAQLAKSAQPVGAVDVTAEMVEVAADKHMQIRGLGMLRPWFNCTEETRAEYRLAMCAALTVAFEHLRRNDKEAPKLD